jgi:glycosyltransferase involved in cell wall biosynthesis
LAILARRYHVEDRVAFMGRLPRAEMMQQLRRAQAIVLPSRVATDGDQEGTPTVLGEAMAAGVPVIASRLGGLREHLVDRETGLLVEPGSVESLAEALREAVTRPDSLSLLASRARQRVMGTLDLETTASRYGEFLESAASSKTRADDRTPP